MAELWSAMEASEALLASGPLPVGPLARLDRLGAGRYAVTLRPVPARPVEVVVSVQEPGRRIWLTIRHGLLRPLVARERLTVLVMLAPLSTWESRVDLRLCLRPTGLRGTLGAPVLRWLIRRAVVRYMGVLEQGGTRLLYGRRNVAA
ncbi:hypothetical protein CCR85_04425 [Rhodothalassium salexigens]|nr:hypothetical protein [Rhodothalassium salexigens]MBK5919813.1 hypothetical protein [Rhodothalassium salexigens]